VSLAIVASAAPAVATASDAVVAAHVDDLGPGADQLHVWSVSGNATGSSCPYGYLTHERTAVSITRMSVSAPFSVMEHGE
jgi:hypothetical protein